MSHVIWKSCQISSLLLIILILFICMFWLTLNEIVLIYLVINVLHKKDIQILPWQVTGLELKWIRCQESCRRIVKEIRRWGFKEILKHPKQVHHQIPGEGPLHLHPGIYRDEGGEDDSKIVNIVENKDWGEGTKFLFKVTVCPCNDHFYLTRNWRCQRTG